MHELQVVNDDQAKPVLALQAPRARAYLGRRQARRVIDEHWRIRHQLHGCIDARPVLVGETPGTEVRLVDPAERRNHPECELLRRHFHGENRGRHFRSYRRILGDVHRERRFAHRRSSGNDHQVTGLQASRQLVEFRVARRDAGDIAVRLVQHVDAVDGVGQDLLE